MRRLRLGQIATPGAADGDMPTYDAATDRLVMAPPPASGVESVLPGPGVAVDATDPAHPVVSATRSEVLMADGVISPPVPIETEAGDDWLYED